MRVRKCIKKMTPVVMALALVTAGASQAGAATLTSASLSPSDSRPSTASVTYTITASGVTLSSIRCIRVEFDTAADGSGSKPAGMSISGLTLAGTSNYGPTPASWTPANNNTTGVSEITLAGGETPANASARTLVLGGITNPTGAGSYYAVINTYNNVNCSSSPVDNVAVAFAVTDGTTVSAVVDPTLTFTVSDNAAASCNGVSHSSGTTASGTAVSLGRVNTGTLPFKSQNLAVSTNANGGYTVYARYTGQMSGPAGTIANWTGTNATPTPSWSANTEAFGYTTSDSTLSGTPNRFTNGGARFAALSTTDSEVSYAAAGPVATDTNCIGYQIGVSGTTKAGSYSTTVVYTAVPVF